MKATNEQNRRQKQYLDAIEERLRRRYESERNKGKSGATLRSGYEPEKPKAGASIPSTSSSVSMPQTHKANLPAYRPFV